jgi:hypothetical protein
LPLEQTPQAEEAGEGRDTRPARGWSGVCCGTGGGGSHSRDGVPVPVRLGDPREAFCDSRLGYRIQERERIRKKKKEKKKGIKKKKGKGVIDISYEI